MTLTNKISLSTNALLIIIIVGLLYFGSLTIKNKNGHITRYEQLDILKTAQMDSIRLENSRNAYSLMQANLTKQQIKHFSDSLNDELKLQKKKTKNLENYFEAKLSAKGSGNVKYKGDTGYYSDNVIDIWLFKAGLKYEIKPVQLRGYTVDEVFTITVPGQIAISDIKTFEKVQKKYTYIIIGASSYPGIGARVLLKSGWQFGYEYNINKTMPHEISVYYSLFKF